MNQAKTQVINKLNSILELIRQCATKAVPTQDQLLMQEVTLAIVTHEGLCKLFEQEGTTQNVVSLVNEFGKAIAELYHNIENHKPAAAPAIKLTQFNTKKQDKNLLN